MSYEMPDSSLGGEQEKTSEQIFEEVLDGSIEDFIREVIDAMPRFKDKKTFIVREAIHKLPKGEKTDENIKIIMDALPDLVDKYLEDNK